MRLPTPYRRPHCTILPHTFPIRSSRSSLVSVLSLQCLPYHLHAELKEAAVACHSARPSGAGEDEGQGNMDPTEQAVQGTVGTPPPLSKLARCLIRTALP